LPKKSSTGWNRFRMPSDASCQVACTTSPKLTCCFWFRLISVVIAAMPVVITPTTAATGQNRVTSPPARVPMLLSPPISPPWPLNT
jgi:hypothetical protein